METNEIINNEEVMETAGELVTATSGKGMKVAAVGIGIALGGLAYKFAVKPMMDKIKAKKEDAQFVEVDGELVPNSEETVG